MPKENFTRILLNGFFDNPTNQYLANYFVREKNRLLKIGYSEEEVHSNFLKVIEDVRFYIYDDFNTIWQRANRVYQTLKENNKDYSQAKEQLDNLKPENYQSSLLGLSNWKYFGKLSITDLDKIEHELNLSKGIKKIGLKRKNKGPSFQELFLNVEDSQKILTLLHKNKYCSNQNDDIQWHPPTSGNITPNKRLLGLLLHLQKSGYIRGNFSIKELTYAVSSKFSFNLSAQTYGQKKNNIDMKEILDDYASFIPEIF